MGAVQRFRVRAVGRLPDWHRTGRGWMDGLKALGNADQRPTPRFLGALSVHQPLPDGRRRPPVVQRAPLSSVTATARTPEAKGEQHARSIPGRCALETRQHGRIDGCVEGSLKRWRWPDGTTPRWTMTRPRKAPKRVARMRWRSALTPSWPNGLWGTFAPAPWACRRGAVAATSNRPRARSTLGCGGSRSRSPSATVDPTSPCHVPVFRRPAAGPRGVPRRRPPSSGRGRPAPGRSRHPRREAQRAGPGRSFR